MHIIVDDERGPGGIDIAKIWYYFISDVNFYNFDDIEMVL
jgi:hypothetical protein